MFRIVSRTTRIGEYDVTVNERYYKSFKKPLIYNWVLQDEPLIVIKKDDELVLVETFKSATLYGEEVEISELTKDFKHVKEFEILNNKLKIKKNSYSFDNFGNPVKNKKHNMNLMLDDIPRLFLEKIKAIHYSSKKFDALSYEEFIANENVIVITDKVPGLGKFEDASQVYLIKDKGFNQEEHDRLVAEHIGKSKENETCYFPKYHCFDCVDAFTGETKRELMYFSFTKSKILELIKTKETWDSFDIKVSLELTGGVKASALDGEVKRINLIDENVEEIGVTTSGDDDAEWFSDIESLFNFTLLFEKGIIFPKK